MSVFIDRSFLLQLSPKLQRFTQKKDDLYNFRCPLCGDSQKNKTKSRGYIYRKKNDYFYMCHNCGAGTNFFNFLKQVDPSLVQAYQLERYKNGENGHSNYEKPDFEEVKTRPVFRQSLELPSIDSLPAAHFAKVYVNQRKIPEAFQSQLYYAEDFAAFVQSMGIEKDLMQGDKRLVIPFYDKDRNLVAFQGRSLGESKLRYITVKLKDDNKKIYGLDRLDDDKKWIYVVEGPIDSMFLENAVATADSNLEASADTLDKSKVVLIFDNEPRNKEIVKQIEKAIDNHFHVVIWPEMIVEKDINDMVLAGFSPDEIQDIIDKNTFVNLRAKFEFINWKKV